MRDHHEAFDAAVEFVASQYGGAERILAQHHPMPGGLCAGCITAPTRYPCQAAGIAALARKHPSYRPDRSGPVGYHDR